MDKDKLDKLRYIKIENFVWIIYIGIILFSYYSNHLEEKYLLYNDLKSKDKYQKSLIIIFLTLLIIYYYFAQDSYNEIKNLDNDDSNRKKVLTYASFTASFLILISGIIYLYIAIVDEEIETELAFN